MRGETRHVISRWHRPRGICHRVPRRAQELPNSNRHTRTDPGREVLEKDGADRRRPRARGVVRAFLPIGSHVVLGADRAPHYRRQQAAHRAKGARMRVHHVAVLGFGKRRQ